MSRLLGSLQRLVLRCSRDCLLISTGDIPGSAYLAYTLQGFFIYPALCVSVDSYALALAREHPVFR